MKITNIQGLRAIAVLLVLFSHMVRLEEKYSPDQLLPSFLLNGISGVDLFFIISGFIMVVTTSGSHTSLASSSHFIYKRASRIFPLYAFYTTLVLCVALIKPGWVNGGAEYDLLSSYLLIPNELPPLLAVGWTLIHEMYFYYIFVIILLFQEKFLLYLLLLWAVVIFLLNAFIDFSSPLIRLVASPLTFEFIGGGLIGVLYKSRRLNVGFYTSILFICLLFILMFSIGEAYTIKEGVQPSEMARVLIYGMPSMVILLLVVSLDSKLFPSWLMKAGDASYSTYLTHVLVLSVIGKVWATFSADGVLDNLIMLTLLVVVCLIYGSLSFRYLETPMLRVSRKFWSFIIVNRKGSD